MENPGLSQLKGYNEITFGTKLFLYPSEALWIRKLSDLKKNQRITKVRETTQTENATAWVDQSASDFINNAPDFIVKSAKMSYTKPEVRERIKKRIMAGSKGGKPGQWSARKAQLVAIEYRKAGGGYRGGVKKTQRSLKKWTREKWTTSDGKPAIRKGGTRRYLPAKAWSRLTPAQRRATNRKKLLGSRSGAQFIKNTRAAESASRSVRK